MKTKDFERRIQHLSQEQILTGSISAINKLLVEKGMVTPQELQAGFLDWMEKQGWGDSPKPKKGK